MRFHVIFCLLAARLSISWSKVFQKCELATELQSIHGLTIDELKHLVCIADFESSFDTSDVNDFNPNGSKDYGIFHLNNFYWCDDHFNKNVCNTSCDAFLDDDLTDDLRCVKMVVEDTVAYRHVDNGYIAWAIYQNRCENLDLDSYISECFPTLQKPLTTTLQEFPTMMTTVKSATSVFLQKMAGTNVPGSDIATAPSGTPISDGMNTNESEISSSLDVLSTKEILRSSDTIPSAATRIIEEILKALERNREIGNQLETITKSAI